MSCLSPHHSSGSGCKMIWGRSDVNVHSMECRFKKKNEQTFYFLNGCTKVLQTTRLWLGWPFSRNLEASACVPQSQPVGMLPVWTPVFQSVLNFITPVGCPVKWSGHDSGSVLPVCRLRVLTILCSGYEWEFKKSCIHRVEISNGKSFIGVTGKHCWALCRTCGREPFSLSV